MHHILFSNSLVRARPALSRKILSSWMARAKIACAWPALFWCCFYQHQSSARPAPGADQRVSERSSTKLRPKFRLHGRMPHNSRAAPRRRGFFFKLKLFCDILIVCSFVFFSFKTKCVTLIMIFFSFDLYYFLQKKKVIRYQYQNPFWSRACKNVNN